jgi:hypothetical protein
VFPEWRWYVSHRADPRALALYERHYSCHRYADGRKRRQFVAPGECLVLLTAPADALFVWHKAKDGMRLDGQEGASCAVFRNEGPYRASDLIREAEQLAWVRWPGARLFTYVDATQVPTATPGFCFLAARWKRVGQSQTGLLLFEKRPRH